MVNNRPPAAPLIRAIDILTRQPLRSGHIYLFYLLALTLYALPLIQANYPYIDDIWRRTSAATGWAVEGRAGGNYLINLLSVSAGTPDLFPVSLLVAIVVLAWALMRLAQHWFTQPTTAHLLVLLPFWYNPYYLQVLAYHYESFTITVGIAFVILAVIERPQSRLLQWGVPVALLTAALSFYQLIVNVYIGLVCVEILRRGYTQQGISASVRLITRYIVILLAALAIYFFTFYQMITLDRGGIVLPDAALLISRFSQIAAAIALFFTWANAPVFILIALLSVAGGIMHVRQNLLSIPRWAGRLGYLLLSLVALLMAVFAVGGANVLLAGFNPGARTFLGLSPLLCLLLWWSWRALTALHPRSTVLLALPLWVCLVFSVLAGQYFDDKKKSESIMLTMLVTDIAQHPSLYRAQSIFVVPADNQQRFIATPLCVEAHYPAMRVIASANYVLLPEQLTQVGITNMGRYWDKNGEVMAAGETVVENPFYRIRQSGEHAFIQFKRRAYALPCFNYRADTLTDNGVDSADVR